MTKLFGLLAVLAGLFCGLISPAGAQSRGNANCNWNCAYAPPSVGEQNLLFGQALIEYQLQQGILNPGGSSVTTNTYNGTVNQSYWGPSSSSGSSVTNINNLNSTSVSTNANGGSQVSVNTTTSQQANGNAQNGSSSSTAKTSNSGVYNAADTIILK
jgi:hypothetical protein